MGYFICWGYWFPPRLFVYQWSFTPKGRSQIFRGSLAKQNWPSAKLVQQSQRHWAALVLQRNQYDRVNSYNAGFIFSPIGHCLLAGENVSKLLHGIIRSWVFQEKKWTGKSRPLIFSPTFGKQYQNRWKLKLSVLENVKLLRAFYSLKLILIHLKPRSLLI